MLVPLVPLTEQTEFIILPDIYEVILAKSHTNAVIVHTQPLKEEP